MTKDRREGAFQTTELFQHNVGVSSTRWDTILAGAAVDLVVGLCAAIGALGVRSNRR